jgi:hypothetical protein
MKAFRAAIVFAAAALACSGDLTAPNANLEGDAEGLQFTASIPKSSFAAGETGTITYTLRNPTNETVELSFSSGCQIIPHVTRGEEPVYPEPYACTAAITKITLPPGEQVVRTFTFTAITGEELALWNGPVLTPGSYVSWAELLDGRGNSSGVIFNVTR